MTRMLIITLIFLISSCSVMKVSTDEGVKIHREFGFINVINVPDSGAYVDLDFIGIGLADDDFIIGYKNSKKVVMPKNACTVFIDKQSHIDSSTLEYLKKVNCTFIYLNGELSNE